MSADCLFCRIAAGQIPAHVIHEDAEVMAFLDLHPIRPGHALVIPKAHFEWFEDMPERQASAVMAVAQRVARALKGEYGVERVAMFFTGIHVPHAHAHLVPMHDVHDVTSSAYLAQGQGAFSVPPQMPPAQMAQIAQSIKARL